MSEILEEYEHTYTKTYYSMTPYEKEVTEKAFRTIGRKCDRCNHIFENTEQYFSIMLSQEYEDNSLYKDICIKCIESECKDYIVEYGYDNLCIGKHTNYLK